MKLKSLSFPLSNKLELKISVVITSNITKNHISFFFLEIRIIPAIKLTKNKIGDKTLSNKMDGTISDPNKMAI